MKIITGRTMNDTRAHTPIKYKTTYLFLETKKFDLRNKNILN